MKKSYLNSEKMNRFLNFTLFTPGKLRVAMVLIVFLFASNTVATAQIAQIAQRGSATTNTSTTTTVDVAIPSGILAGDVLIATINQADNDRNELSNATLTDWQLVGGAKFYSSGGDEWWGTVLYKVATATDVSAANFTFAGDRAADDMQASIIAFSGVDQTNPIDVAGTFTSSTDDNTSLIANSITTTTNNAAVIMLAMISNDRNFDTNWNTTSPGGLTELFDEDFDATLDMGIGGAWAIKPSAGATGNGSVTLSDKARDGAILIALRPACTANTAGTASSTPTLCINTALTDITITTTGATGIGTATGLPAGVTAAWASNTITISGTPTASGIFNYSIPLTGGCGSTNATGTITVSSAPNISFQQGSDDNSETIDLCGAIGGGGQNDIDINSGAIAGATYQWEYSTVSATGPWIVDSYTGVQFNIASFSHTPGTYYFRVLKTYGCSVYSDVIKLVVRNSGTSPVFAVQGSSRCTAGTVTLSASSATAGTYNWYDSALGGTLVKANSASFITPVLNITTTYYVTFTPNGQTCPSPRAAVTGTLAPLSVPTVGTITQPTCATPTIGSVVLNDLPEGGILKIVGTTDVIPYSGTTATVSLGLGTYTFTVSNGSCDSSPVNVTISPVATNTWNGTSWSPNTPTDVLHLDQNIVFEGDYGDNKNLYGCSCEVKSGNVVIHENYTLKVTNEVKVTGGSLTFLNTASLVQTNDVANTGNITYNRTTPTVRPTDYVYWSSPVSGQTIANFSPTVGSIKYYYDLGWKAPSDSDVMVKGLGYIIRGQVTSNDKYDASFVGVPNNGPVAIPANTAAKYYLVGNPYPSAIDADEFLDQNAGLDGNVYLWTHNTEIAKNAAGTEMVYTSDDYANYNFTGSTSTFKSEECKTCPNNAKPIGKIAAGQSFFVKTISATTIQFNNDMRLESKDKIDNSDQNSQFFRTTNTNTTKSKTAVVEKHRLWLNLTNNQGAFKQTLIGYVTGATNDLDARYDGQNFNGNAFINFYSINQNKNFTIQGRALPFDQNDEVALGFKSTMKGSFTIAIDEVDGLLANQAVFIEDKLKGVTFNLKTGNYTFDTEEGTFNERFVIRYINRTLATEDFTIAPNKVLVSVKNKQMKIIAAETIDKVVVYDLLGREIYTKTAVNSNELVVSNLVSGQQALVVKVVLQNGSSSTKKIVY